MQVIDRHLFKFKPSMDGYVAGHFNISLHILLVLICAVPKGIGLLLNHFLHHFMLCVYAYLSFPISKLEICLMD
jgi:hypothetical protein